MPLPARPHGRSHAARYQLVTADDRGGDVLVVGAGPVGLTLANDLSLRGIGVRVIDALPAANPHAKAHGLQSRTLEALDVIGLGQRMMESRVRPEPTILNWQNGRYVGEMPAGGPPHEPFPYQVGIWQQTVERVLADALAERGHTIERGCKLVDFAMDNAGVTARVERAGIEEELRAGWIVGCDGGKSTVRSTLGLRMEGRSEPGKWFIGEFDMDWAIPRDVIFIGRHKNGAAAACFDRLNEKWHAWVTLPDASLPLSLDNFNRVWHEYTGLDVRITEPLWMHELRVNYGTVDHYRRGRALLAGDAAHVHSSAGGQGLNAGVQDALNLGWKLALEIEGDAAPGLLQTYDDERVAEAHNVLALSERMHRVMYPTSLRWQLVSRALSIAMRRPALAERFAARRMSMLHIHYRGSALSEGRSGQAGPEAQAGCFLPHAACRVDGVGTTTYDVLRGPTAELLLCAGDAPTDATVAALGAVARTVAPLEKRLRTHFVFATEAQADAAGIGEASVIIDSGRHLRRTLGLAGAEVVYVRPDGYIGYRSTGLEPAHLSQYLNRIYAPDAVGGGHSRSGGAT